MTDLKTATESQYSLKGDLSLDHKQYIDATIILKATKLEIVGRINSEKVTSFLKSINENFSGWIEFDINVSNDGTSTLSLQNGHGLTLNGKVKNFDLEDLRRRIEAKQEGMVGATASALHKLAGEASGSDNLDKLSDLFAEEVKNVGQAPEIKPLPLHTRLLRLFSTH